MIKIDKELFEDGGLCTVAFPKNLIELRQRQGFKEHSLAVIREENKCTGCALCAPMCPDIAIRVYGTTKNNYTLERSRAFSVVKGRLGE